jgi:sulfate adenylyltransferase
MIQPHGGRLIQRIVSEKRDYTGIEQMDIPVEIQRDLKNIGTGVFSPLEGFLCYNETESVLKEGRLPNGVVWTLPILLPVNNSLKEGDDILLGNTAVMHIEEVFSLDKRAAARSVYGTDSAKHPGVNRFIALPDTYAGGKIDVLTNDREPFSQVNLEPKETRVLFKERKWKTVAGFQTRNPPHTGHENLQKTVLGLVDGIFINPLIGRKKPGDFTDSVILNSYKTMIEHYLPRDRAVLSILSTEMRYAGPKEAVFHAICRKNFGCTHFIVGRDHAGVGNFYEPEAAIKIFDEYSDIGIKIISVKGDFFFCQRCGHLASERTCPHDEKYHIKFSGTRIRELLKKGENPPEEIMRPEVFEVLLQEENPFVGD